MAGSGYLPRRDDALLAWAQAASGYITSAPTSYGLTASIATGFASAVSAFQTALAAVQPGVRNETSVLAKNNARAALKTNIRAWVATVNGTATVTNVQRRQLGLSVRAMPSPVPAPSTPPNLDLVSVIGRTVTIKIHDGVRRGRPSNAIGATIMSYTGTTPPASLSDWHLEGQTGRSVETVVFPSTLAPGATVYLVAFWVGTRKEPGPACDPVSVTFGAAGVGAG